MAIEKKPTDCFSVGFFKHFTSLFPGQFVAITHLKVMLCTHVGNAKVMALDTSPFAVPDLIRVTGYYGAIYDSAMLTRRFSS
jgi:hypothetical protein